MVNKQIEPLAVDLRGTIDVPFGFLVEESERYRLGFTYQDGKIWVWVANWGSPDSDYASRAKVTLAKHWPNISVVFGNPR